VSVIFKPIFIAKNKKKIRKVVGKARLKIPENWGGERKISVKMPLLMFGVYQSDSPSRSRKG